MGIYNGLYSVTPDILPPQSVSLKEKLAKPKTDSEKTWGQQCMDALEAIGKSQFNSNLKLIENYEMIKGRFIYSHYFETEGYESMLNQLSAQFELPNYLRHYDIISQVVNTMSGEWQKRPDIFKVREYGDNGTNEYLRKKQELTTKFVMDRINAEINKKLAEQGIDVNKQDFKSQEEQQQFQQQVQQQRQQMTPMEIQKYMDTDFLTQAELWGQHQKELDRELFNLAEKEKLEFEDMLVADRCFRHFRVTATGYDQETWNPINVFFHKSPDIIAVEDGDYVGRIFNLSINTIIDRYGYLMTKDDWDLINAKDEKDKTKWSNSEFNWVYENYLMPFKGYPAVDIMKQSWNTTTHNDIPFIDGSAWDKANDNSFFREREGYYFVTEAYWKTQKKLYKLTYQDPQSGEILIVIVDENFKIPKEFSESKFSFDDEHDINTYCETTINEVWKGIKINTGVDKNLRKDLYLQIGPNDFQFKGDINRYGCKLPVCGQVFSVRNSHSMSLVDMMKPYQIGYNVVINQMYQLAEKEIGMFVVMDVNMFPNSKDWGGEDSWDKWMLVAKNMGILPADTSPQNIKNSLSATGGFLPKVLDLNLASQMVSRMNLAKFYEEQALKQVGFNQYRTGNFASSSTATGVQQGEAKSYAQTESYFTNFSNYLRRCQQMALSIAQFVQSQKEDITFTYIKSDMSRAFIKILGMDLLLSDLGVLVSNSQENARQLEMIRQYALSNNTSGMTPVDVANVIMMNNPHEIRRELEKSFEKLQGNQQQEQEFKQKALDQDKQLKEAQRQQDHEEFEEKLKNELDKERIKAGIAIINAPSEQEPPAPDNTGNELKQQQMSNDHDIKSQKLALDKEKTKMTNDYNQKKLALGQAKINADLHIQNQHTETARILKNKELP